MVKSGQEEVRRTQNVRWDGVRLIAETAHFREMLAELRAILVGLDCALGWIMDSAALDALSERIIGCAIAVHRVLGPGLLESIYRDCLAIELRFHGLPFVRERAVPIYYRGERARDDLRIDIVVNEQFIVEVKAVERLHPVHQAQVISYLKLTGCPAGLLLNFNTTTLRAGIKRLNHPDEYARRRAAIDANMALDVEKI